MYQAKETGGGCFEVFDAALRRRLVERLGMEDDLRHALELDQLELHYQPLVSLEGEEIVGFEALLRWHHPVRGLVQPLEFIGIAEETGLIRPIGSWVLRTACAELAHWPEPIYVSVNLSAMQGVPELVDEVTELVGLHGLRADRLVLEITEGLVLDPRTKPVVAGLRSLGVHVALDDFGTGYSSLGSLQRFPIDVVQARPDAGSGACRRDGPRRPHGRRRARAGARAAGDRRGHREPRPARVATPHRLRPRPGGTCSRIRCPAPRPAGSSPTGTRPDPTGGVHSPGPCLPAITCSSSR
jgi:hypothetical protein